MNRTPDACEPQLNVTGQSIGMSMPSWRRELEDYPAESRFVEVADTPMHYVEQGQGRPVLMVHGNPTWSFYYRHLIQAVAGDFRAIAMDHVGCGLSEKPLEYNYCLDQHIHNLNDFISKLDLQQITLVVHDWGGPIGLGAALQDLSRFESFVVLNTGAFPPPYIPWRIRVCRFPLLGKWAIQGLNLFARAATTMATQQRGGLPQSTRAGLLAPYDCWSHRVAIHRFVADIPTRPNQPTWKTLHSIEQRLPRLRDYPIKIIWGMQDWCFRTECLDRFRKVLPQADVTQINDAGHYILEDAADQVSREVRQFLGCKTTSPTTSGN